MEKPDLKDRVLTNLRSVTQSCKGGVPLTRLNRDYRDLLGSPIPFKELGYTSLESFIQAIPHVICLRENKGQIYAEGVADNTTAHIVSLVSRQKQTKPVVRPGRKPYRRGGFSSRYKGDRNFNSSPRTTFQPVGKVKFAAENHSKSSQPTYRASNSTSVNFSSKVPAKKFDLPPRFQKLQQQREVENNRCSSPTGRFIPSNPSRKSPEIFHSSKSPLLPNPTKPALISRTIAGASSSQTFDNDYSYPQRNLRPLRPKNDDRAEKLKLLKSIENAKDYIDMYAEIYNLTVEYQNLSIGQKKKNKGYTSVLKLGGKGYQSYPDLARTEDEAEDIAARKAVQSIQESKDFLTALPETPIRTEEEVQTLLKNIEEIVCEKPTGIFSHGVSSEYESKYEESLPEGWIEKVKESSNFDVEQVEVPYGRVPDGVSWIIRPARNYSSGSTTPSEVSVPQNITNGGDIAFHKFERPPLPKVPELVVPNGNEWAVYITYASSYIAACLVDHDDDFVNFSKSMCDFYGSYSLPVSEVFEKHLYAFVRDACDGKEVKRVLANTIQNDSVECYFLDEGHYSNVDKSDLHDLHNDFFKFPYQAIHLALDGLESYEPFMKPGDLEILQEKTLIAVVKRFRYTEENIFPNVQGIHKRVFSVVLYDTSDEDNDLCLNDHLKQSVLESWECRFPEEGTLNKGYLTHITETGEIFVRFLDPINSSLEIELDKLSMEFEEACLEYTPVSPNEVCVAKFMDGKWYRAELMESPSVLDPDLITVFFIDYGHPSHVKKSEVCSLLQFSEFLASLGKQALQCELHNVLPSLDYQWTDNASMMLLEFAPMDEELMVRVVVEGSHISLPKVNLHKRITSDPSSPIISINEKISAQPHLFQLLSDAHQVSTALNVPTNLNLLHTNTELLCDSYSSNKVKSPITPDGADFNKIHDGIEWLTTPDVIKSPDAYDVISPSSLNPPEVPNEEEMFDVFVTIAATPHNFIVQPLQCAGAMNNLRMEMQQFYTTEENLLEMDLSMLRKNCFYAALHPDGEWYRVRVVSITEDCDHLMAAVYYVDFGDFGSVGIQNLQLLSQRFRNLPCQAIKASLSGIKPAMGNDWNPVHCVKFKEMVTEKNFVSIVKSKIKKNEQDFCSLEVEVVLIDTSDPKKDVYISDHLIALSMALPCD